MVKKIPKSSCFLANNLQVRLANRDESWRYFDYLQESDNWFRMRFDKYPRPFGVFAKLCSFKQLKGVLGQGEEDCLSLTKEVEREQREFVEKMKKVLENIVFCFGKNNVLQMGVIMSWQQPFTHFLCLAASLSVSKKIKFKKLLQNSSLKFN